MSFVRIVHPTINGPFLIQLLRRGISKSVPVLKYSIPKNDDPTPRTKIRMNKIITDESYYIRKDASGVDKTAIDRVVFTAKQCLNKTHDYPKLQRCLNKARAETRDIEDVDIKRQVEDTLTAAKNARTD